MQQDRDDLTGRRRRPAEDWLEEDIDFAPRRRFPRREGEISSHGRRGADHAMHGVFVPTAVERGGRARAATPVDGPIGIDLELTRDPEPRGDDPVEHELRHLHEADDPFLAPPPPAGTRRTVQITGRPGEAISRRGRGRGRERSDERRTHRPDRVALWAVVLGLILIVLAAMSSSSDAATPPAHLPAAGTAHVVVHHAPASAPLTLAR